MFAALKGFMFYFYFDVDLRLMIAKNSFFLFDLMLYFPVNSYGYIGLYALAITCKQLITLIAQKLKSEFFYNVLYYTMSY